MNISITTTKIIKTYHLKHIKFSLRSTINRWMRKLIPLKYLSMNLQQLRALRGAFSYSYVFLVKEKINIGHGMFCHCLLYSEYLGTLLRIPICGLIFFAEFNKYFVQDFVLICGNINKLFNENMAKSSAESALNYMQNI